MNYCFTHGNFEVICGDLEVLEAFQIFEPFRKELSESEGVQTTKFLIAFLKKANETFRVVFGDTFIESLGYDPNKEQIQFYGFILENTNILESLLNDITKKEQDLEKKIKINKPIEKKAKKNAIATQEPAGETDVQSVQ